MKDKHTIVAEITKALDHARIEAKTEGSTISFNGNIVSANMEFNPGENKFDFYAEATKERPNDGLGGGLVS